MEINENTLKNLMIEAVVIGLKKFEEEKIMFQKFKSTERVRRFRLRKQGDAIQVMIRDNNTCQYCGKPAIGVDHLIPVSKGGTEKADNLVACCLECNRKKNNQSLSTFLNLMIEEDGYIPDAVRNEVIMNVVEYDEKLTMFKEKKRQTS